jgi:hypothetical protein
MLPKGTVVRIPLKHQPMDPLHKEFHCPVEITATLMSSTTYSSFSVLAFQVLWNCSVAINSAKACSRGVSCCTACVSRALPHAWTFRHMISYLQTPQENTQGQGFRAD